MSRHSHMTAALHIRGLHFDTVGRWQISMAQSHNSNVIQMCACYVDAPSSYTLCWRWSATVQVEGEFKSP